MAIRKVNPVIDLTVLVIANNEATQITHCLASVKGFAPVIVLDDHSLDQTRSLALAGGAQVYTASTKQHHFAKLREEAAKYARTTWLLYLDADERLTPELKQEIQSLLATPHTLVSQAAIPRYNYFLGKRVKYGGSYPDYVVRLFNTKHKLTWCGELHEQPKLEGNLVHLTHPILHYTHRDLSSMTLKTIKWTQKEARLLYLSNHPPVVAWRIFRMMLTKFWHRVVVQSAWRDGAVGMLNAYFEVFNTFIIYARLWEMQTQTPSAKKH